jgi:hypothetical protein
MSKDKDHVAVDARAEFDTDHRCMRSGIRSIVKQAKHVSEKLRKA